MLYLSSSHSDVSGRCQIALCEVHQRASLMSAEKHRYQVFNFIVLNTSDQKGQRTKSYLILKIQRICKYIYIYTCRTNHTYMYVCMSVRLYVLMSVCPYVCVSVCLYVCMSLCLYVSMMSVCLYVCMSVCMDVRTYVRRYAGT